MNSTNCSVILLIIIIITKYHPDIKNIKQGLLMQEYLVNYFYFAEIC